MSGVDLLRVDRIGRVSDWSFGANKLPSFLPRFFIVSDLSERGPTGIEFRIYEQNHLLSNRNGVECLWLLCTRDPTSHTHFRSKCREIYIFPA